MSDFTKCNFCTLQWIRKNAVAENKQVILRDGTGKLKGVNVYLVPKGVEVPKVIVTADADGKGDAFHEQYFTSWFMALTDKCAC